MNPFLAYRPSFNQKRADRQKNNQNRSKAAAHWAVAFGVLVLLISLSACSAPVAANLNTPTPNVSYTQTFAAALQIAQQALPTSTLSPTPTSPPPTATFTPTAVHTPEPLPPLFTSPVLAKDVLPQTYITDTCEYLKARWDPNNSAPGTVVMISMYHSVTEDYNPLTVDSQVHHSDVVMMMEHAHELGFQTITTQQLVDFLNHNAKIPLRSLLIIVDDRKREEFYETHFVPLLEEYGWSITNAWISAKDTPDYLWKENQSIVAKGWVDVQAHGVVHNTPIEEYSSEDYIRGELSGSITAIEKWFGKRPVGFIWPGGGFTKKAVEMARSLGYEAGFTTNPRGPVMYNWIPQAAAISPEHPLWLPEIPAGDPRMTLPRYWSNDAAYRLDDVIHISKEAIAAAQQSRANELDYYDVMCKGRSGPIPTAAP